MQTWTPFHYQENLKYNDISVDFHAIDANVQNDGIYNRNHTLSHEIIGYLPYWQYDEYPDIDYSLLTQINYFSAELDKYGNISNDHNWDNIAFIEYAQERGVKVKLCATLFGQDELTTLLQDSNNRSNAINNLLNKVLLRQADGIDIDFELLPYSQKENLLLFIEELSYAFHEAMDDPIITMATPAVDWNNSWDYNQLALLTDGLFIMGYNYFYAGSDTAGPISPLGGYTYDLDYTLNDYLNKTNNNFSKLILGLPYYGYDWPVVSSIENSSTTDSGEAKTYSQAHNLSLFHGSDYSTLSNAPWISYYNNQWHQCWYDDSLSLSTKYQFAKDKNIAGIGIWALGYDDNNSKMWGSISDQFYTDNEGDLNNDGNINIVDIIQLVTIVLNNEYLYNGDFNSDSIINIIDIIALVNIVLDRYAK
tara:strand:+ start:944 stop:2206 length:1263 start_codon:yes stop_codon:yes gene_type:complete